MPWSALPEHLNSPKKWKGTDNDTWWMRWEILTKGWWAFGPRAKEQWAKWREIPIILFAARGQGSWRYEQDEVGEAFGYPSEDALYWFHREEESKWYLSRIQYYCRWHFAIQWPLQVSFHAYWDKDFMPNYPPIRPVGLNIKRFLYWYGPTHRDADKVYWIFSFFIGGCWK